MGERVDPIVVLEEMRRAGLQVSWEHPGCVQILISPTLMVATGFHGWEYGSVSRLIDDTWEPDEEATAEPGLPEDERSPQRIAEAWVTWVQAHPEH